MKVNWIYRPNSLFKGQSIENVFSALKPYITKELEVKEVFLPGIGRPLADIQSQIQFIKAQNLSGLTHILGDVHYLSKWLPSCQIHTFHDIESLESGNRLIRRIKQNQWIYNAINNANSISVVSYHTKSKIVSLYPQFENKIRKISNPLLLDTAFEVIEKKTNQPFQLLSVGTKQNKNIVRIALALSRLPVPYKWHVVGELDVEQEQFFKSKSIDYEKHVNLKLDALCNLYASSDLLVFPSIYEGFGLPIIEAQAYGVPVITSNITAMPEVGKDSVLYVNPYDVDEIEMAIYKLINKKDLRMELVGKGYENIQRFKIENIAKQYIDWYREVLSSE